MGNLLYLHFSFDYDGKWHDLINQTMKYLILSALHLRAPEEMFLQRLVVVLLVFLL